MDIIKSILHVFKKSDNAFKIMHLKRNLHALQTGTRASSTH